MPYTVFMLEGRAVAGMGSLTPAGMQEGQPPVCSPYVMVDDIEVTAPRAKELGAVLLTEPMAIADAGSVFVASDPIGSAISVWQADQHDRAGVFNVPGARSWNELACRDVSGAKRFHTELLGWGIDVQQHADFTYTVVKVGDRWRRSLLATVTIPRQNGGTQLEELL
jgi:hypothetical protein